MKSPRALLANLRSGLQSSQDLVAINGRSKLKTKTSAMSGSEQELSLDRVTFEAERKHSAFSKRQLTPSVTTNLQQLQQSSETTQSCLMTAALAGKSNANRSLKIISGQNKQIFLKNQQFLAVAQQQKLSKPFYGSPPVKKTTQVTAAG